MADKHNIDRYLILKERYAAVVGQVMRKSCGPKPYTNDPEWDALVSSEWCLGGMGADEDCRSADPQPDSFEALDILLESICPNISLLQYKRLWRNAVETRTASHMSDGYDYAYRYCLLYDVFEELIEMGLIQVN